MAIVAGMGGGAMIWQGLDYAGVDVCHRRRGGDWTGKAGARLWGDLQAMEAAALVELNGGLGG